MRVQGGRTGGGRGEDPFLPLVLAAIGWMENGKGGVALRLTDGRRGMGTKTGHAMQRNRWFVASCAAVL